MAVDLDQRVSVPRAVIFREVDDEAVILNLANHCYYGLNGSGTRMLKALQEASSIRAAMATLLDGYEVEPERLREDLSTFVEELLSKGMLELGGGR